MNYLSHHFFYALDNEPYHNIGLVLPDLSRSALGRRKVQLEDSSPSKELLAIQAGCEKHYEADEWFHQCLYFETLSSEIDQAITLYKAKGLFASQRSWFLGHILSEMILDRLIMEEDSSALDRFYQDLNSADLKLITKYLLKAGKTDTSHFEKVYSGFSSSEFIRFYASSDGMVESLNRLVQRTKQPAFSGLELEYLSGQMDHWIQRAVEIEKPHQMARLSKK